MTLLQVENLSVFYPNDPLSRRAVEEASFSLYAQESLALIGESGCGKTSLIEALLPRQARREKEISGQIFYKGKPLREEGSSSIAFIFQDPLLALNPTIKVGYQLRESLLLQQDISSKAAQKEALSLLEEVYLLNAEKIFHRYPHELSRGMLQRITIAMALAQKADLIVADEPTTALDITTSNQILSLLQMLQKKRGFSLLLISHHLALVREMCQRTIVMHQGKIVEEGPTQKIFSSPRHPATKRLVASAHFFSHPETPPRGDLTESLFSIRNISKNFSSSSFQTLALNNVSLEIRTGEIFGLVGESGSGKSTLAKLIAKLFSPTSGDIFFEGKSILQLQQKPLLSYRQKVQMIFQDPQFCQDPQMSICKILEEPLIIHTSLSKNEREEKILRLFEEISLCPSLLKKYPHELSGGQSQRVGIARALILEPTFLILDEPTSSLDLPTAEQLLSLLLSLHQKKHLTSLLITHDLFLAKKIATKMGVLYRGRLVEVAPAHQLFAYPRHPYTKLLLSSFKTMTGGKEKKETIVEKNAPHSCPFFPRCSLGDALCKEQPLSFQEVQPSHFVLCHSKRIEGMEKKTASS